MLAEKINKARAAGLTDDEIATFISEKDQNFAGKFSKSREAGLTSAEVLDFIAGPKDRSSPVDPSYLAEQFAGGLGKGIQGYANTAEKLGADGNVARSASQLGQAIASGQRESASERFMNPREGDTTLLGFGVGSIPGAIAESGAGMLADLGAMAAGGAVAGPVGALALPMASYGLREYGTQLDQRVANQGGAPATGTDQAATAASVLAQSALNRLALGKVGGGASVGNRGLVEGAKRIAGATGTEAVTEGAQQLTEQVGATAGTQKGLTIDPRELAGAAVLGGATGGAFRTAGEAGTQFRNLTDAVNTRGLQFKEEAGNVASEINRIIEENNTKLGNSKGDTNALLDYESRLDVMASAPTKRAVVELDALLARGELSQADHAKAKAALTERANVEGLSVAERAIGGMGEGADAIAFAKRRAIVNQLKDEGGFSRDGVIKGGISAKAERLLSEARATLTTAGLGGGLAYAGYKGLGTFGATLASIQGALPAVYALGTAYAGAKALDSALGTASPVGQLVRRFGQADNPIYSPSSELPTWADLDQAEKQRQADAKARSDFAKLMTQRMKAYDAQERLLTKEDREAQALIDRTDKQDAAKFKEQARTTQQVRNLMAQRAKAQNFDEQGFVDQVENSANNELIAESAQRVSAERKAANLAMQLAQAQQKLDLARNIVRPASEYESIATIRDDPATLQTYLDKARNELAAEGIRTKADKATKKGSQTQSQPEAQSSKKGRQKASQNTGPSDQQPSGQVEPDDIDPALALSIKRKARIIESFNIRVNENIEGAPKALKTAFNKLNGNINNYNEGKKHVKAMMKKFPEQADFIYDFWMDSSEDVSLRQNLAKLYVYNDGDGNKIIMTRKEADKRSGR